MTNSLRHVENLALPLGHVRVAAAAVVRKSLAVALGLTLAASAVAGVSAEPADRNDPSPYLGIWQGNDPLDGGLITLEITKHAGDPQVLDLRFSDTFIRACTIQPVPNLPQGDSVDNRRGIYLAYARPEGSSLRSTGNIPGAGRVVGGVQDIPGGPSDQLLSPAGARLIQTPIYCYKASAPDRPFLATSAYWQFRNTGDMLLMTGTLFTDDPDTATIETADGPNSMRFHRLAGAR